MENTGKNTLPSFQTELKDGAEKLNDKYKVPFLKGRDWLAEPVNFYYRGDVKHGTIVGGFFSCGASIFFFLFVVAQLFGWLVDPLFSESISVNYLTSKNAHDVYDITLSHFLPTFAICDDPAPVLQEVEFEESCNNRTNWNITFVQEHLGIDLDKKIFEAADCAYVIGNMTDITPAEKASMMDELVYDHKLCPNITSF